MGDSISGDVRDLVTEARRRNDWGEDDAVRLAARLYEGFMADAKPIKSADEIPGWDAEAEAAAHTAARAVAIFQRWAMFIRTSLAQKPGPQPETQTIDLEPTRIKFGAGEGDTDGTANL